MRIEYDLDRNFLVKTLHIVPTSDENVDELHSIATRLYVDNPAIKFSEDAKAGLFNNYSDNEYDKCLQICKRLSLLFCPPNGGKAEAKINLFELTVKLLFEYMLNNHSESSRII